MNRQDLISVVVPTFNAEQLLAKCLDSIAAQTHPRIELIVVDGGSHDRTVEIARTYAERFSSFKLVSERDAGIYDAMNKGVGLCTGDWVYFIGSDDELFAANSFETMASYFTPDVDLLYGNVMRMTTRHVIHGAFDRDRVLTQSLVHQAIFYRRGLLARVGSYNLDYKIYADWDLNIRCFALPCRPKYVEVTVCKYASTGLSSHTTDHTFLERKLHEIARVYRCSFWSSVFRSCRYNFLERGQVRKSQRRFVSSAYYYALFVFHTVLAKFRSAKTTPLSDGSLARGP